MRRKASKTPRARPKRKVRKVRKVSELSTARHRVEHEIKRASENPYPSLYKHHTIELLVALGELLLLTTKGTES